MRCLAILISLIPLCAAAAEKPNIIIVLADDLGFGDVGANNPESQIATPHLDRLAREGMRFTDAHSSSSVCTPTRYSLLTGRYHWRTRLQNGVLGGFSRPLITPERTTLAGLLHEAGYHTACFGKWHLGMHWPLKSGGFADDHGKFGSPTPESQAIDYSAPIKDGPLDRGFDTFYGISASLDMFPFVWIHNRHTTEAATATKTFLRTGPAGPSFEAVDVQSGIMDRLLSHVADRAPQARRGQPFFAYVALASPHTPIVPSPAWQGRSRLNAYADFVMQLDADIGRLLETLVTHNIDQETLLIFTSDNGCSPEARLQELQTAGHQPSHIYRGHKADIYEGGHRIPFLARWPGHIPAHRVNHSLIGQIDLMATIAEITGQPLAAQTGEDSISFLPTLLDKPANPNHPHTSGRHQLVSQSINGTFALRDGAWKLILGPGSGGWSRPQPGSREEANLPEFQLYDLETDPSEKMNLVADHPERVARMKAAMESLVTRGRSTPGPDLANDVPVTVIKPVRPR